MRSVALMLLVLFAAAPVRAQDWQETYRNIDYDPDTIRYAAARDALVVRKRYRLPGGPVYLHQLISCTRLDRWDLMDSRPDVWSPRRPLYPEDVAIYRDRVCALARAGALPAYDGPLPPA